MPVLPSLYPELDNTGGLSRVTILTQRIRIHISGSGSRALNLSFVVGSRGWSSEHTEDTVSVITLMTF